MSSFIGRPCSLATGSQNVLVPFRFIATLASHTFACNRVKTHNSRLGLSIWPVPSMKVLNHMGETPRQCEGTGVDRQPDAANFDDDDDDDGEIS